MLYTQKIDTYYAIYPKKLVCTMTQEGVKTAYTMVYNTMTTVYTMAYTKKTVYTMVYTVTQQGVWVPDK